MSKSTTNRLDQMSRAYNFIINPYPDQRLSRCPFCEEKTGQRKRPLMIHVDPDYPLALNYTCRYCRACDLLIAHKHELEHLLTELFKQQNPAVIGNDYQVMGVVDKKAWRAGLSQPKPASEVISSHLSLFKTYYEELRLTQPGWYLPDAEPHEMLPPPSTEWVKRPGR